jgi:hypothetical protein
VEKTHPKSLSLLSESGGGGNTAAIDVYNGRILRVRPFHYVCKCKIDEFKKSKVEAREKVFESGTNTLLPPALGYMTYRTFPYFLTQLPGHVLRNRIYAKLP